MPTMNVRPLKPTSNAQLVNTIRNQASSDYRARIPKATQANIRDTMQHLHNNRPLMNEFIDVLVNRIGSVIVRNKTWDNPLAQFKRGMLQYGDTIEEIQTGLLTAHTYDPDRESLEREIFGTELVPTQANFHKVNRENYYKFSVNRDLLMRAFLEEGGLSSFIDGMMNAPVTSDNWDEFLATCALIPEYESNGGFHHVRVGDIADWDSDGPEVRLALRKMRALADTLPFVSTKYNAARMPTFAQRDELVLLVSPEYQAAVDVEALAGAFNVSKADMYGRVVTIPKENFGVDEIQAILTTKDFFVIADQLIENTTAENPVDLHRNYFLHHWQVISASRFVPAIAFTKNIDDEIIEPKFPTLAAETAPTPFDYTDGIAAEDYVNGGTITSAQPGSMVGFTSNVSTSPEADDYAAVAWSVTGQASQSTYISSTGVLHVAGDETAKTLTIIATSVAIDPSDPARPPIVQTSTLPVSGPTLPGWPLRPQPGSTPKSDTNTADVMATLNVADGGSVDLMAGGTTATIKAAGGTLAAKDLSLSVAQGIQGSVKVAPGGKTVTVTLDGGDGPVDYTVSVTDAAVQSQ